MAIKFTNNAGSKLTQAITADATSMNIKAEDVSKFPVLGSGDYCLLTLVGDNGNHEIIKVTNISSDGTCTIERAQDSTTAKAWDIDTRVELRITAEYLNDVINSGNIEDLLPDKKTIEFLNNHLTTKDIAIGGDINDLASNRGILGNIVIKPKDGTIYDLDTFTQQGKYFFYTESTREGLNFPYASGGILIVETGKLQYKRQIYLLATSRRMYTRTGSNEGWNSWVEVLTTGGIGDGIINKNGIISVPEYEGATSSAAATSGLVPPATSAERNSFLRGDGTWVVPDDNSIYIKDLSVNGTTITYTKGDDTTGTITTQDTTYSEMTGATSSANGTSGLVPTPQAGEQDFFLRGDGTWAVASGLPLTGGTMTGPINRDGVLAQLPSNTSQYLALLGSTTSQKGSGLYLYSDTSSQNGLAILRARGADKVSHDLRLQSDGGASWDGKQIVRSVNGATADSTGNVSTMPVGSIYVQFSGQSAPADLFGGTWSNVSSTYAGLFFRAEGGDAAAFGSSQGGGLPDITGYIGRTAYDQSKHTSGAFRQTETWSNMLNAATDGSINSYVTDFYANRCSALYGAATEVRPDNSTIRIWKRMA